MRSIPFFGKRKPRQATVVVPMKQGSSRTFHIVEREGVLPKSILRIEDAIQNPLLLFIDPATGKVPSPEEAGVDLDRYKIPKTA